MNGVFERLDIQAEILRQFVGWFIIVWVVVVAIGILIPTSTRRRIISTIKRNYWKGGRMRW
jgi:hypothetical protein